MSALVRGSGQRMGHNGLDEQVAVVTEDVAKTLTTSNQRLDVGTETFVVGQATGLHHTQTPVTEEECSPAISKTSGGMAVSVAQNQRGEVREGDLADSLPRGGGKPGTGYSAVRENQHVRRLTPTECERLMSWPDGWTCVDGPDTADSPRYAACGNGVVSNVAEWIGRRIMAVEAERRAEEGE